MLFNSTVSDATGAYALGYELKGSRGLLLVNKRPASIVFSMQGVTGGIAACVDGTGLPHTPGLAPPAMKQVSADGSLELGAFGVAVLSELEAE